LQRWPYSDALDTANCSQIPKQYFVFYRFCMSTWYLCTIIGLKRFTVTTLISSHRMLASHTAPLMCGFMNFSATPPYYPTIVINDQNFGC